MRGFSSKHPIVFEIILTIAGFILALAFSIVGQVLYFSNEVNMAIGRILAGCLLLIVFLRSFDLKRQVSGLRIMLPALLFAVWNIALCFLTGTGNPEFDDVTLILAFAPALFEEVIFRGIFIHNLKASGMTPIATLIVSAVLFGAVHLTNIVGMPPAQVLIQAAYAVVVGLVFGAVYIRSGDLVSLIAAHFAIDFTSRAFPGGTTTPHLLIIVFVALMILEAAYAFHLCGKNPPQ